MISCKTGDVECCKLLIQAGANVQARSSKGLTAESIAKKSKNKDLLKALNL